MEERLAGIDGKPVTYKNGSWSSNTSKAVQRVGAALMETNTGTERLSIMFDNTDKISIFISPEVKLNDDGSFLTGAVKPQGVKLFKDGKVTVEEYKMTIYEGSIYQLTREDAGDNQLKGLSVDEAIGVVAGHESGHTENENTKMSINNKLNGANNNVEVKPNQIDSKINVETRIKKYYQNLKLPER